MRKDEKKAEYFFNGIRLILFRMLPPLMRMITGYNEISFSSFLAVFFSEKLEVGLLSFSVASIITWRYERGIKCQLIIVNGTALRTR